MSPRLTRFAVILLICMPAHAEKTRRLVRGRRLPSSLVTGVPAYKLNTILGVTVCQGSALATGFQFGTTLFPEHPFYIGPELNFSLYSPGSILGVLVTGWYELGLTRDRKLTLIEGFAGGAGFAAQLGSIATTSSMFFIETTLSQEIDDLFSIRGQVRPGFIGKTFALMTSFSVSFRFY